MVIPAESSPPPGWDPGGIESLLSLFPTGRLSEIIGSSSSGASSLLMALVARATTSGGRAALVDGSDTFDPASASAAGADLSALLWVRCGGRLTAALGAADLLARCHGFTFVAVDLGEPGLRRGHGVPRAVWVRLARVAEESGAALVLRAPERLAGSAAALVVSARRLGARWTGWPRPTRLGGLSVEARVLRGHHPPRPEPSPPHGREGMRGGECWTIEWRL